MAFNRRVARSAGQISNHDDVAFPRIVADPCGRNVSLHRYLSAQAGRRVRVSNVIRPLVTRNDVYDFTQYRLTIL